MSAAVNTIGFITNSERDSELTITKELAAFAVSSGFNVAMLSAADIDGFEKSDFIVVLGGDGTMLSAAKGAAVCGEPKPLLGINLGTLGYLTDVEKTEAKSALRKAIDGEYKLERRMMLDVTINSDEPFIALNEAIVKRIDSKMTELTVTVNGEYIDTYRGDGIIVTTPSGSTAYNLSAGGPILKPDGNMIAITPICPHTLYARPIVISSDDTVTIKPYGEQAADLWVAVDGQNVREVCAGDTVAIKRSKLHTVIMKTNGLGFYDILRLKMMGEQGLKK